MQVVQSPALGPEHPTHLGSQSYCTSIIEQSEPDHPILQTQAPVLSKVELTMQL